MQISTLRRIVEALGGELEIVATLPTGRITLSQFKEPNRKSVNAAGTIHPPGKPGRKLKAR